MRSVYQALFCSLVAGVAGCYKPAIVEGGYACKTEDPLGCPDGYVCAACPEGGHSPDIEATGCCVPSSSSLATQAAPLSPVRVCDGGKTNVDTDLHNCGSCGHDCATLTGVARASCVRGRCIVDACQANLRHCPGAPGEGCETDVTKAEHCGSCKTQCVPTVEKCSADEMTGLFGCVSACTGDTPTQCDKSCVDLKSDPRHCGDCETDCPTAMHGAAACMDGMCGVKCDDGFALQIDTCVKTTPNVLVSSLSMGSDTACVVASGVVKCWGDNSYGLLGSKVTASFGGLPTDVAGLSANATSVNVGYEEAYTFYAGGAITKWGGFSQADPSAFSAVPGATFFASGSGFTCALTGSGAAKCWGFNYNGELGNGTTMDSDFPVDVKGLSSGVAAISAHSSNACALVQGVVKCWGDNYYGQLGTSTGYESSSPLDVAGLGAGVLAMGVGSDYACAVTASRGVKCWGYNSSGTLGVATPSRSATPLDVPGVTGAAALALGSYMACVLLQDGTAQCWGAPDFFGAAMPPTVVVGVSGATAIASGRSTFCAVVKPSGVKCWGDNTYGQLGDGSNVESSASAISVQFPIQ